MSNPIFDFAFKASLGKERADFKLDIRCRSSSSRLGIIGPSGAGKSLTLQVLAGLRRAEFGYANINGSCIFDCSQNIWKEPQKRQVGMVFQHYALFPHLTVAQNISFSHHKGLLNPRQGKKTESTQYWLERMQLEKLADSYPWQISGGQQQRVALARACNSQPKWLLLDEPFSALDADLRQQMRLLVQKVQQELSLPMLIISHDAEDTDMLADEVAHIKDGFCHHGY